jgi:hypothetical protein
MRLAKEVKDKIFCCLFARDRNVVVTILFDKLSTGLGGAA